MAELDTLSLTERLLIAGLGLTTKGCSWLWGASVRVSEPLGMPRMAAGAALLGLNERHVDAPKAVQPGHT